MNTGFYYTFPWRHRNTATSQPSSQSSSAHARGVYEGTTRPLTAARNAYAKTVKNNTTKSAQPTRVHSAAPSRVDRGPLPTQEKSSFTFLQGLSPGIHTDGTMAVCTSAEKQTMLTSQTFTLPCEIECNFSIMRCCGSNALLSVGLCHEDPGDIEKNILGSISLTNCVAFMTKGSGSAIIHEGNVLRAGLPALAPGQTVTVRVHGCNVSFRVDGHDVQPETVVGPLPTKDRYRFAVGMSVPQQVVFLGTMGDVTTRAEELATRTTPQKNVTDM